MNHAQLVIGAHAWLKRAFRCRVVVSDLVTGAGETPDVIGWDCHGRAIVVECKASRSDFLADRAKPHRIIPWQGMGAFRYFFAVSGLITPAELPAGWGLAEVGAKKVQVIVRSHAVECYGSHRDLTGCSEAFVERSHCNEALVLLSAIRRLSDGGIRGRAVLDLAARATK